MISVSFEEFMSFVAMRQVATPVEQRAKEDLRERVLRPDQKISWVRQHDKHLATCPECDALVDADILHPHSGLCPICHEEARLYR